IESKILASEFWDITQFYPDLQRRILNKQPELLFEKGALQIDSEELISILPLLRMQDSRLDDFVFSLICKGDENLIPSIFNYFPAIAAKQVIKA
ncbi:hypothetical protein O6474_23565, partial [Salmonella enterica subsp. enterica]